MLRESAAIVSLCARRRLRFASRISSTAAVVRARYWRTERIISAGGSEDRDRHRRAGIEEEGAREDPDRGDTDAPAAVDLDGEHLECERECKEGRDVPGVGRRSCKETVGRGNEPATGDDRESDDEE